MNNNSDSIKEAFSNMYEDENKIMWLMLQWRAKDMYFSNNQMTDIAKACLHHANKKAEHSTVLFSLYAAILFYHTFNTVNFKASLKSLYNNEYNDLTKRESLLLSLIMNLFQNSRL